MRNCVSCLPNHPQSRAIVFCHLVSTPRVNARLPMRLCRYTRTMQRVRLKNRIATGRTEGHIPQLCMKSIVVGHPRLLLQTDGVQAHHADAMLVGRSYRNLNPISYAVSTESTQRIQVESGLRMVESFGVACGSSLLLIASSEDHWHSCSRWLKDAFRFPPCSPSQ